MNKKSILKSLVTAFTIGLLSVFLTGVGYAQKPKEIKLNINNEKINLETKAKTVENLLEDINYEFIEGSKINYKLDDTIEDNMIINIETSKKITINHGNNVIKTETFTNSVAELLDEEKIDLSKDDIIYPSLESKLEDGQTVTIEIIEFENYSKSEDIDFETIEKNSFKVNFGESKVSQEGEKGKKELKYVKTYKNGQLISDELDSEEVIKEPIDEIILNGTKEVIKKDLKFKTITKNSNKLYKGQSKVVQAGKKGVHHTIYKNDGENRELIEKKTVSEPINKIVHVGTKARPKVKSVSKGGSAPSSSKRVMYMNATAYTPDPAENGGWTVTALGTPLRRGVVAVDPRVIPLGTRLYIEGYGYARAEDTGGAIKGNKIDLLFMTKSESYRFGRRQVKVHVLGK